MRIHWLLVATLFLVVVDVGMSAPALPSAEEILKQMITRGERVQEKFKEQKLNYSKRSVLEMVNQDGAVKDREEKLYDVLCKGGRVRMIVMEVNGQETKEAQRREETGEVKPEQAEDMKPPRGEERPLVLTEELLSRYHFEVMGVAESGAHSCYKLQFAPKSKQKEDGLVDRFLNRLGGKLWVDQKDYEVVRGEIELQSPVNIWGGIVGAVNQFHYTLERHPVGPDVWFNRTSRCDFELRKLLVSRHYRTHSEWENISLE